MSEPQCRYLVADLFCGADGSSTGARRAIEALGREMDLVAVNHWDVAVSTHARNHPEARHHCIDLDAARPEALVPEGRLDLLMASPECVFFSRARGGRPVNDQRRMSAWHIQRWASALDVRTILVENVPEFRDWGPLLPSGRPDPKGRGLYFEAWIKALWAMGYAVDWRLLNAADYGDATTRTRFFLQARKDGVSIRWPEPTHSPTGAADLFGTRPRWRAAREVIDWNNPGRSLLTRKRPLSLKTRLRIARGLARFGGPLAPLYIRLLDLPAEDEAAFTGDAAAESPSAFVMANRNHNVPRSADEPVPVMTTAAGGGLFLATPTAEPFVSAQRRHTLPRPVDEPMPTITAESGSGGMALVEPTAEPFVLGQQSCGVARLVDEPLPTIATGGAISLTEPTIIPYYGTGVADRVDEPLATVTTKARFGLCCPLVVPYGPRAEARDAGQPLPTVLTRDRLGVCVPTAEPFLVPQFGEAEGQAPRVHDLHAPLPAVTSHGAGALVAPSLVHVAHAGEHDGRVRSVDEPLPVVTTKRSVALVEPVAAALDGDTDPRRLVVIDGLPHLLDIRFRMLTNRELARAMGFDDAESEYEFTGNVREVTKQIGNAVAVHTAAALVSAILADADDAGEARTA